ncbi:MAG: hypothetical protein HUU16_10010 [Candidatus Omnitrophica bacterium]|nr:hypothetical protein [bacterium]NUN96496.1 hypothetical protein [Candidatus Omnitrophota bacterium]
MLGWAGKLLYIGAVFVALAVLLRVLGYNDTHGFLQPPLTNGITPDAFMRFGSVCALFAIALGVLEIAKNSSHGGSD